MKYLGTALLGAAGILALSVTGASAAIVCNEDSDCWHVKQAYDYPSDVRVHVYGDDFRNRPKRRRASSRVPRARATDSQRALIRCRNSKF